ncbi:MAG: hypothetical protein HGB01_06835 [Chlorobiaceae bacterium]|nr:hypothetical protein [Chlorobiaceae bacterium]
MNRIWTPEYAAEFDVTDPEVREFIETRYLPYYRAEIAELFRKVAEGDQEAVEKAKRYETALETARTRLIGEKQIDMFL